MEKKSNIRYLVYAFNIARINDFNVEEIARKIASSGVKSYTRINENLAEELIESITQKILEAEELKFTDTRGNFTITDDGNNLIFKNGLIGLVSKSFGSELNEFFNSKNAKNGAEIGTTGIITSNYIAEDNKVYIINSPATFDIYEDSTSYMNYKKILQSQHSYVCKVYDENGIESINYVYPNQNQEDRDFIGNLVRYTKDKKELLGYNREINQIDYYHEIIEDKAVSVSVEDISTNEWETLKQSTNLHNTKQGEDFKK